jgi:hypothetical protein
MPGLSNVKVSRASPQRQMEKPKPQEEKQMNRIKKADKRKTHKNKSEGKNAQSVISTAACSGTERPFPP